MRRGPSAVLPLVAILAATLLSGCTGGGSSGSASNPRAAAPAPYQTRASQSVLPVANGFAAASYDLASHKVDAFREHVYSKRTPTETTRDLCYDAFFGWRKNGQSAWLSQTLEESAAYLDGTGIAKITQRTNGLLLETYLFAPMTGGAERAIVMLVRAVNEGPDAQDCAVFSLMNFHMGGEGQSAGEWAFYANSASPDGFGPYLMEGNGSGTRVLYRPIGPEPTTSSYAAAGAQSPYARVAGGEHLVAPTSSLNANDIACGFEWRIHAGGTFAAGAEMWAGLVIASRDDGNEQALKAAAKTFTGSLTPQDVLAREVAFWDAFHATETLPANLSGTERALYRQSTAVIKMAQVREPGGPDGQILASLPPGIWNICWPRDAAYAITALSRSGHLPEAKKGLEFMLNGTADQYRSYVGRKYKISVCRYYGNGLEESDDDGTGPNVEFDDFGLFLWAFCDYVERSQDGAFLVQWYPIVRDEVADVLVSLIAQNGLLSPDSSIWERHWNTAPGSPSGRKQFAYSSINAANGLARLARVAQNGGDPTNAQRWSAAAQTLTDAIVRELSMADGALASSFEEKALGTNHAACGANAEALNHGLVAPTSRSALATLDYLARELRAWPVRSPGYLRTDDARHYGPNNKYDRQEWVVIDLRLASALIRAGRRDEAKGLIDWVGAQSAANMHLIAELYDEVSSGYDGAVPMAGFGAGAYIHALHDWHLGPAQ